MNKISIVNDCIKEIKLDNNIHIETILKQFLFEINTVNIEVQQDSDLYIDMTFEESSKLQLNFNLLNDVNLNLYIISKGEEGKIKYNYNLNLNSNINIYKYNDFKTIKEMILVNLNNKYATFNYVFKTISKGKETYDYVINHNAQSTISNIKNNAVNISGNVIIQISSSIPKDIINCVTNQNNRIINLTDNRCEIRPILYIDTDLVDANHSALIGDLKKDELFYLSTMGITKKDAYNLLIRGFLLSDLNNELLKNKINDDIIKYWR